MHCHAINSDKDNISFKPVKIDNYAKEYLFKMADTCLLMSATILNVKLFTKWLGIPEEDYIFIRVKSNFNSKKIPIFYDLVGKMSIKFKNETKPKTIPKIKEILKKHHNDKGLIHTNSYEFQKYISTKLKDGKRIMTHGKHDREKILEEFEKNDTNKIIISPSLAEGVDLPYDDCRFQIIYKIPFPYLSDPQIVKRKNLEPKWYAYKTIITLVQEYGRIMRAENDYGSTYILDSSIENLSRADYDELVPEFFKEAIVNE